MSECKGFIDEKISKSITSHYDNLNKIDDILLNYKQYIERKYIDDKFTYNIHHPIWFNSYNSKSINIISKFSIIAFSEHRVIYFIIKPSLNELNIYDSIYEVMFKNYCVMRVSANDSNNENSGGNENKSKMNNFMRYNGKEIIACVITFDSLEPVFYEINAEKYSDIAEKILREGLTNIYGDMHLCIVQLNKYIINKYKTLDTVDLIKKIQSKLTKNKSTPHYILNYFKKLKSNSPTIQMLTDSFCDDIKADFINEMNALLVKK
jgi:hypothetical protein